MGCVERGLRGGGDSRSEWEGTGGQRGGGAEVGLRGGGDRWAEGRMEGRWAANPKAMHTSALVWPGGREGVQ